MASPEVNEEPAKDEDIVEPNPETLDECVATISLGFGRFVKLGGYKGLDINLGSLHVAVKSWHDDLFIYRKYHKIVYLSKHKQVAFLMQWITKTKPIFTALDNSQVLPRPNYSSPKYLTVNEAFAVALGLTLMGIDPEMVGDHIIEKLIYDYYSQLT